MRISIIVAMSENQVIGHNGDLPWHLPEDLKRFKRITMGKPIVMGRKTHDSIGRPLPGRENVVLTRQQNTALDSNKITIYHDLNTALDSLATRCKECFIIGGGNLYAQTLPKAHRLLITYIHQTIQGDTHFPDFDKTSYISTHHETLIEPMPHSFSVLMRKTV